MGIVRMTGPPDRAQGHWCVACLMRAKQKQWEMYFDKIEKGYEASGDVTVIIEWPPGLTKEMNVGIYRAVCYEFQQLGIVEPLCWDDVAGINPSQPAPSHLDTSGTLPPGLRQKKG